MSIEPSTLVLMIISFVVLMLLLNKLLFKPMLEFMAQRQQKIENGIKAGEQAEAMLSEKKAQLAEANVKAKMDAAERISYAVRAAEEVLKSDVQNLAKDADQRRIDETTKLYEREEQLVALSKKYMNFYQEIIGRKIAMEPENNPVPEVDEEQRRTIRNMVSASVVNGGAYQEAGRKRED